MQNPENYSRTPTGENGNLGDSEGLEREVFTKRGGNFDAMKNVTKITSDETLRIFNNNVSTQNYKQDPLYQYMENLESKAEKPDYPINYHHFSCGIKHKIKNRTLKQEDYELLYDTETDQIRQETFKRYFDVQSKYKNIGIDVSFFSIFDNHKSGRELEWYCNNLITLSKDKSLKQSLEFLEDSFDICLKMTNEGVDKTDIGLYLSNNNYQKVIDIKKKLGDYGKFHYSHDRDGYRLWASDSGKIIAKGETLEDIIDDFCDKQWLFEQKDKIGNVDFGDFAKYLKSPVEKMQYVNSQYRQYEYLNAFWRGENNAESGFSKPSSGYGLGLRDTFGKSEYETSARILMKTMKENGNERWVDENLVENITKDNLLKCGAIKIEDGLVIFQEQAIKKINQNYEKEKNRSIESLDILKKFFDDNGIILPS